MKPKEVILKAFEGGKPDRLPVTLFGAGMWSIKGWGTSFEALSRDADKMTSMLVDMSGKLQCDIVYPGSGYNNFHASALGGKIKWREIGAPDLENHFVSSEEDLAKLRDQRPRQGRGHQRPSKSPCARPRRRSATPTL